MDPRSFSIPNQEKWKPKNHTWSPHGKPAIFFFLKNKVLRENKKDHYKETYFLPETMEKYAIKKKQLKGENYMKTAICLSTVEVPFKKKGGKNHNVRID